MEVISSIDLQEIFPIDLQEIIEEYVIEGAFRVPKGSSTLILSFTTCNAKIQSFSIPSRSGIWITEETPYYLGFKTLILRGKGSKIPTMNLSIKESDSGHLYRGITICDESEKPLQSFEFSSTAGDFYQLSNIYQLNDGALAIVISSNYCWAHMNACGMISTNIIKTIINANKDLPLSTDSGTDLELIFECKDIGQYLPHRYYSEKMLKKLRKGILILNGGIYQSKFPINIFDESDDKNEVWDYVRKKDLSSRLSDIMEIISLVSEIRDLSDDNDEDDWDPHHMRIDISHFFESRPVFKEAYKIAIKAVNSKADKEETHIKLSHLLSYDFLITETKRNKLPEHPLDEFSSICRRVNESEECANRIYDVRVRVLKAEDVKEGSSFQVFYGNDWCQPPYYSTTFPLLYISKMKVYPDHSVLIEGLIADKEKKKEFPIHAFAKSRERVFTMDNQMFYNIVKKYE